jgi:hypothetical protein
MRCLLSLLPIGMTLALLMPASVRSEQLAAATGGIPCNSTGIHNPKCATNPGASTPCSESQVYLNCRPLHPIPDMNKQICAADQGQEACKPEECSPETDDENYPMTPCDPPGPSSVGEGGP